MKLIFSAFFFLLLLASCVFAVEADLPVSIKAETLKYSDDSSLVEAYGSVEVSFKAATIRADRMRMDSATNIITAEGRVRLSTKDQYTTADYLTYDASQETASFLNFESEFKPKNLRGKLFLKAQSIDDRGGKMYGGPGTVSTCDEERPHFFLEADKIEYYPDDKVTGQNVTIYVGEIPTFWTPYFFYDLSHPRKRNWVYGRNQVEGDFLKTAWSYPLGLLLLDFMDKKGLGYGTELGYRLAKLGFGTLYLYHQDEKDTGISDWISRINHHAKINPYTEFGLVHRYTSTYLIPSGRMEQTALDVSLSYADKARWNVKLGALEDRASAYEKYALQLDQAYEKTATNYYYNYEFSKIDPQWIRKSQRFYHRQSLFSDRMLFNVTANYYHGMAQAGDPGQEKVEPQIEFTGTEPAFSWRYTQNWFVDLHQNLHPGVLQYEYLEKNPEIEIYPKTVDLKLFTLQSVLGWGYYREVKEVPQLGRKRDYRAYRLKTTLNAGKNIPVGLGTVMVLGAGLDQFLYGPGDQLFAYRENAGLQTSLASFFKNDLSFRRGDTEGNTPFFFDKLGTSYHDLREQMTFYQSGKFDWTIEGGRNYQTRKWFDVMTRLNAYPAKIARCSLNTGWDIENRRYKDLVTSLHIAPGSIFSIDLSAIQDLNGLGLKTGSAFYDLLFLENEPNQMRLRFSQVFDPSTKETRLRDIIIIKDLHCWEMKFTYSDYLKQFGFVYTLKAMPGEPVGFTSDRGFYFEGFEKQMQEFKNDGEVRRY